MNRTPQGSVALEIDAPPAAVWAIVADSSRLPEWVPVVQAVVEHAPQEMAGVRRRCAVDFGGRAGYMVEECVDAVVERRLEYIVVEDSLGFGKLFADYAFTLDLEPVREACTRLTITTYYRPRGFVARAMNALLMRRRFAKTRRDIALGLKAQAERDTLTPAA